MVLFQISESYRRYTDEMHRNFRYFATWLPNVQLELGDIGTLENNYFTRKSCLKDEGIQYDKKEGGSLADEKYTSYGSVSETIKISGKTAPTASVLVEADAGVIVEFKRENSIYFKAKGTKILSIKNQNALEKEVLRKYINRKWTEEWAVITELVKADSATILISSSSNGHIELKTTANTDIADAEAQVKKVYSRDISTEIIAEKNVTPLFKLRRIKKSITRKTKFPYLGGFGKPRAIETIERRFEEVEFEPYKSG